MRLGDLFLSDDDEDDVSATYSGSELDGLDLLLDDLSLLGHVLSILSIVHRQ